MPLATRECFRYDLNTGAGAQTITQSFPTLDLSHAAAIKFVIRITKADADAGDTLNITFEDTWDAGVTWNERARSREFIGSESPSTTAPETQELTIQQLIPLAAVGEEALEPSGSGGGSALSATSVRNGPFPRTQRSTAGARLAAWRMKAVVVDANSNGDFEGVISAFVITDI